MLTACCMASESCTCAEELLQVGVELLGGGRLQVQLSRLQMDLAHPQHKSFPVFICEAMQLLSCDV